MRPAPEQTISKKALPVWRIQASLKSILVLLLPVGYMIARYFFAGLPLWPLWPLLALFVLYVIVSVFIYPIVLWRKWRYDVLEQEIDLQYGVLIVRRTLIPMTRVQHVDTEQGPLLRKYQLAAVTISTASSVHRIPALSLEVADRLRDRIAVLAAVAEDE
ncbi:PH domain-containing protein [Halalkalibacterium halodurans]|uniref:YdbS-like PH domain-containing protein n=1 Tax=Halalkalibacterium halodurans TaxID=86665 RepID=A0A0M0KLL0_ALKHA|nr:PH domain-containing protein [Halalkalibacterium halodurans]MDY7222289.1 PH domain-containing protein [Halalkalibacterium halodurans]MDY7241510.1 PH domain-containing protein [Halalkalibacterium halodurans]MED3646028.1 PH domain-containing protein [Halalkalibacterium halodurans]MED4123921.1 PH domain-containing protein [Halalkalibacterium halodurans]MED4162350.1 PH domain-containing protein [Halalkalibacterium halodurans]